MQVFIDGKRVKCLNDVQIIHEGQIVEDNGVGDPKQGDLRLILNYEGMIADVFEYPIAGVSSEADKSMWKTLADIIEETH